MPHKPPPRPIQPHGGYERLKAYQMAEIVYDATIVFCRRFLNPRSRTVDQMEQAARSGKQNLGEGSMMSGTSRKMEMKLVGVARASLQELLIDYGDFLRTRRLRVWGKNHAKALEVRRLASLPDRSYATYAPYVERGDAETAANVMVCALNQTNYLVDRLEASLEERFLDQGGFTERLYRARTHRRREQEDADG